MMADDASVAHLLRKLPDASKNLVENEWVMLMKPVAQPLADVGVLNHADDAGDVRVLQR